MTTRESVMYRQVCDPPDPLAGRPHSTERADSVARRERERALVERQRRKTGRPCPHGCGFYLSEERYGQALCTHERGCPKVRV